MFEDLLANPVVAVIAVVGTIIVLAFIAAQRYVTVGPNQALVVSGRRGTRVVTGGGTLVLPVVETSRLISLELMTVDLKKENVYTKTGVPVNLTGVVQFRVGDGDKAILTAAKAILGQSRDQIQARLEETLDGHLRAICGGMTPIELVTDRDAFSQQVVAAAADDLVKMGFIINSLTVKELSDKGGYYDAWGTPEIQKITKEAKIATAEADREARQKSALAKQAAVQQEQESAAKEAEFTKETNIKIANYKQETETKKAIADQANPIETAKQSQVLKAEQMKVSIIEQEKLVEKTEMMKQVRQNEGEAEKLYRIKLAEAQAVEAENKGKGEGLEVKSRQEGEANGNKAKLLAEAEGNKAKLLANAEGTKAQLLAEAEGVMKRAEALAKLNETGKYLETLKAMPAIVNAFTGPVEAAGKAASQIGNVTVIQTGDSKGAPTSPITKGVLDIATTLPPIMEAYGLSLPGLLGVVGMKAATKQGDEDKKSSGKAASGGDDEGKTPPSAPAAKKEEPKAKQTNMSFKEGKWVPETQSIEAREYSDEDIRAQVQAKLKEKAEQEAGKIVDAAADKERTIEQNIDDQVQKAIVDVRAKIEAKKSQITSRRERFERF